MSSFIAFLFAVIGSIASWSYNGTGRTILHWANGGFIFIWVFVFIPVIWGAYIWQARATTSLFNQLNKNKVFSSMDSPQDLAWLTNEIQSLFSLMLNKWTYVVMILMVMIFWVNEFFLAWPSQFLISQEFWFEVKWYLPIHILGWTIGLIALFLFIIRQILFIYALARFFSQIDVDIKPLNPDDVGGFGPVGDFVKHSLTFAILFGLLAVLFAIEVQLTGEILSNVVDRQRLSGVHR